MTVDEKIDLILSEVSGMKSEISDMKSDISGMKSEISDMKSDISGMKSEISDMKEKFNELEVRQDAVESQLRRNNVLIENEILPKLDIMIEAQQVYEENFPSVRKLKTDVELLKVDVSILKTAVKENVG
ncbi:MAG: hypothetical protein LUF26_07500 [Firmicutes bacterium]|nr:hypothetical protein [Bacillota bacterium]